ncbi:hypothetical protein RRG08_041626 [Elysia crispata]|uniref:Treslin STD domain-containing protein n=1 Tax=Elysia crispata TaxID=231223 RepID=A0AAE0XNI2_9GAST|nr:hypothetical protein RRG08_041626 [Elysia crispata]
MSSATCSRLTEIEYAENCRKILHETCSKLGGKFMAKNSIIGCVPLLPIDNKPVYLYGNVVKPNFGLNWIPTECHTMDILSGDAGSSSNSDHVASYSAVVSIPCFGLQDVPVTLISIKKISVSREKCLQEQSSRKWLISEEISGASLTLYGLVQRSSTHDKLIHLSSQSFMLDIRDCEAMTQFLQTLEASNTLALLNLTPRKRAPKVVAILQSQQSVYNLTFLNLKTLYEFQSQAHRIICSEKKEKESSYLHYTKHPKPARDHVPYQIYQSHCMNYWHIPGSTNQMSHIIASLQDRLNKDRFFSRNEKGGLKRLKQFYAKERQPKELIQNDQPVVNTPLCAIKKSHQSTSGASEKTPKASLGCLKRTTSSILQRGRLMVDRARSASLLVSEDVSDSSTSKPDCTTPEKHSSSSKGFIELDLKSEDDLLNYLKNQYEQILKAYFAAEIAVSKMITITSQFMVQLQVSNPQRAAANFIQDHLSLEPVQLKEKYQTEPNVNDDRAKKIAEYKLQVLLVMETESLLRDHSDHSQIQTEKVVALLRGLSFSSGAPDLKSFLTDIVASYSTTMPKQLVDIYDELMIPLPLALKKFASPAGLGSVYNGSFDQDASFSSAPSSSQPSSVLSDGASQHTKRSSRFRKHPSFADYCQKKKILVEPLPKQEPKGKVERKKSKTRLPTSVKRCQGECDKAKRNLFSEYKPKAKTSKVRDRRSKTRRKRRHTLSTTDKARTLVLGTPIDKQKHGWHIQQQERRRLRDNVQPDVQTVAESPLKENDLENVARIGKPARFLVREAFYSSNSQQSRNFAKALEQSQKTDGFPISEISYEKYPSMNKRTHGTLASAVRGESPALSPRTRLFKTLMPSPSPSPKSQRREHTLQVTTPGRPSKRLAKRLDFSNMGACSSKKSIQALTHDAQLIFDGENANDFNVMKSPSKKLGTTSFRECFKTPEKQIKPSRPDMWSSASCPPPSLSSSSEKVSNKELNFRNTLFRNAKSGQRSPGYQLHRSPHTQKKYAGSLGD